ncbi:unnamed protein product [Leptosia nina]|uniref:Uncharacterized protein n=1 Tax=Leptosia nina TaxID=320188 RepID=A0AAV1K073_9NEOP
MANKNYIYTTETYARSLSSISAVVSLAVLTSLAPISLRSACPTDDSLAARAPTANDTRLPAPLTSTETAPLANPLL